MATALAGRISYFVVLMFTCVVVFASWACFMGMPPAWLFIAAAMAIGFVALFSSPFQVPMLIEADPSRKAAVMGGATQVLAGALGPLATALIVSDSDVHGAILLGAGSLVFGLALIASLHFTATRNNHAD